MPDIFISYRRDDSSGHAGRLFDCLRGRFGDESVFMDVTDIQSGVDFTQARVRAQAGFADLADLLPAGPAVWGSDERAWRPDPAGRMSLDDSREEWLAGAAELVGGLGGGVRAVLGFCAGAAPACALAHRLGRRDGTPPPVVLFDPTAATARTLHEQFEAALGALARGADAADVDRARDAARRDLAAEPDPARLADLLVGHYGALAEPACAAQGVPAAIAAQLTDRFATHLRYLALAAGTPLDPPPGAVAVLSAGHAPPPLGATTLLRLDADATALLADPRAAAAAQRAWREPAAP